MKSDTLEWVAFAERDFEVVNILKKIWKPPYEIIAYHCQQSAEKYLKAVLIENESMSPLKKAKITGSKAV